MIEREKMIIKANPAIRKFKAGPLEAEFELAAKEIRASAAEVSTHSEPKIIGKPDGDREESKKEIVASLLNARNDPSGIILDGWGKVDGELFRFGHQLGKFVDPLEGTTKVYESILSSDVLPAETGRLVRELRDLRNKVAHVQVLPTSDAAQDYIVAVDRVVELIHNYRKNLPNYGSTNR